MKDKNFLYTPQAARSYKRKAMIVKAENLSLMIYSIVQLSKEAKSELAAIVAATKSSRDQELVLLVPVVSRKSKNDSDKIAFSVNGKEKYLAVDKLMWQTLDDEQIVQKVGELDGNTGETLHKKVKSRMSQISQLIQINAY